MRTASIIYLLTILSATLIAYDPAAAYLRGALLASGVLLSLLIAFAGRRWGARGGGVTALTWIAAACALLAAAVAAYFLLTHDWTAAGNAALTAGSNKFGFIQHIGLWLQAHRPTLPLGDDINGNIAGGALVLLLPIALAGAWQLRHAQRSWAALLTLCVAFSLVSLLLTSSRGAWLGLISGAFVAAILYLIARRVPRGGAPAWFGRAAVLIGALTLLASLATVWAATSLPDVDLLLRTVMGSSAQSRATLWRDGLALAGDYIYTGAGLGTTQMLYSTYAMILHVGYITHAHNLFLQVVLEQGLPALLAFLALLLLAWRALGQTACLPESILSGAPAESILSGVPTSSILSGVPTSSILSGVPTSSILSGWASQRDARSRRMRPIHALPFRLAAAASLTALIVHGTLDAGPFASRLAPLIFLPIGFALALRWKPAEAPESILSGVPTSSILSDVPTSSILSGVPTSSILSGWASQRDARSRRMRPAVLFAAAPLLLLALLPAPRAALQANLGALAQSQAELSVYRWPQWPIQDALRRALPAAAAQLPGRSGQDAPAPVDLTPAVARYRAALALDPANVTANRRLGQIELSQGDYAAAQTHLEAAYAVTRGAGRDQYATRLLLGELHAVAGRTDQAAALWRGLDVTSGQLDGRIWWHTALGEAEIAARIKAAAELAKP